MFRTSWRRDRAATSARFVLLLRHRENDLVLQLVAVDATVETSKVLTAVVFTLAEPKDGFATSFFRRALLFSVIAKNRHSLSAVMLRETEDRLVLNVRAARALQNVIQHTDRAIIIDLGQPENRLPANFRRTRVVASDGVDRLRGLDAVGKSDREDRLARCLAWLSSRKIEQIFSRVARRDSSDIGYAGCSAPPSSHVRAKSRESPVLKGRNDANGAFAALTGVLDVLRFLLAPVRPVISRFAEIRRDAVVEPADIGTRGERHSHLSVAHARNSPRNRLRFSSRRNDARHDYKRAGRREGYDSVLVHRVTSTC